MHLRYCTASAIGPCPTVIQFVGRPGTGSLPSTIAPPDHPFSVIKPYERIQNEFGHMTKMTATPIYEKKLEKSSPELMTDGLETWYVASGTQVLPR